MEEQDQSSDVPATEGPGGGYVAAPAIVMIAAVLFALAGIAAYTLVAFWPIPVPAGGSDTASNWFSWHGVMADETQLFIIVLAAGALGGLAHSVRSFYWYVGNRNLHSSWTLMYLALPLTGSGMALLTYLVLRGGLTTSFSTTDNVNPYGIAAISALAGLFSREAVEKLKAVFEVLLSPAEKGKDSLTGTTTIDKITPAEGAVGDLIKISGAGLSLITQVRFGGGISVAVLTASESEVTTEVPAEAVTGPLKLIGPAGAWTSRDPFTVTRGTPEEPDS
ncbi:hypothetical protein MLP_09040 [Microlunatus phosphovorus NM-1]|uniref:IPT/TIG domain-containing protein n=1 Tax=Microlunatus phosphovorus (strain ATCC 700054 / DSM 10555 / JCM 9379 / NBRC 101784 / NCIMB 13414 / VKM Ac-1990 / NM-1) TaxID=1032480 RepID=F5XM39_MICPN|nr:IPT/TIG domain-containing protein [Microlunatus phosphovorus]BAK33918.1 hypothetical protein MLP_09040 [Microlunatus phosphovorus NM-1]